MNIKAKHRNAAMTDLSTRTITLTAEAAALADELVARGVCASTEAAVRAGLEALRDRDASMERWLIEAVAPAHDAMAADPSRGLPAEAVFAATRARLQG
jgi:antitoxin ParD1/3/4